MGASVDRGGLLWRVGSAATIAWIDDSCTLDLTITSAIPPVFDAFATIAERDDGELPAGFIEGMGELEVPFGRLLSNGPVEDGAWLTEEWAAARAEAAGWQAQERLVRMLKRFGTTSWWLGYPNRPQLVRSPAWG